MKKVAKNITELIGETPMVELSRFSEANHIQAKLIAKIEASNPGGSVKDRVSLAMIEDAERKGILKQGGTMIEPTSGNTGIGLALVAAVKGYKLILTMPESMSVERRKLAKAYGAEIVLTPSGEGIKGAIAKAEELRSKIPGAIIMGQFDNPANPAIHYTTTAKEIWRDTDGEIDIFVAGVGTGGTVSGVGRMLKELKPSVRVIAVEPLSSPVLKGGAAGPHKIQGVGAGFIPKNYDAGVVDQITDVSNEDAIRTARELAQSEGLIVGISSGAAAFAALKAAQDPANRDKVIVVLLPDTGERYLSTELFDL